MFHDGGYMVSMHAWWLFRVVLEHAANHDGSTPASAHGKSRAWGAALRMAALIAGLRVLRKHANPLAGIWPCLLLWACALMQLFHGHGGHGQRGSHRLQPAQE